MHGGNIYTLLKKGFRYEDIIDFSASINPLGMPQGVKDAIREGMRFFIHYPDPEQMELRNTISLYHDISPETVVAGNGSTELIYLIVRALRPRRVLLPAPTFSEYERASRCSGSDIVIYELKEENNFDLEPEHFISFLINLNMLKPIDMVFLCNPNNPTGRLVIKEGILRIAQTLKERGIYLVVDEAFIDFTPEQSVIRHVSGNPYLIVLRSMTKFYGLAGLRLGYGVFHPQLIEKILPYKEPWTVNTPAQIAGTAALLDNGFRKETLKAIDGWKKVLEEYFQRHGIYFIPSSVNFYLFKFKKVLGPFLEGHGMLIRDCSDFIGLNGAGGNDDIAWFRIAVRSPKEMERFFEVLSVFTSP